MPSAAADPLGQIVGMRRLTEAQYRNSIADIFGPDIVVAGQHCPLRLLHTRAAIDLVLSAIDPASRGHNPVGAISVIGLLLILIVQVGSGLLAVDIDGIESGPLSYLLDFDQGRQAAGIHVVAFNVVLGLAALHILAILYYLIFRKHDLIRPMITGKGHVDIDNSGRSLVRAPLWRLAAAIAIAGIFAYAVSRGFRV